MITFNRERFSQKRHCLFNKLRQSCTIQIQRTDGMCRREYLWYFFEQSDKKTTKLVHFISFKLCSFALGET